MTDPVTLDGEGTIGEFDEKRAENAVRELLHRGRGGPGPRGPAGDAGRGWRGRTRRYSPGLWQKPGGRADDDVRPRATTRWSW